MQADNFKSLTKTFLPFIAAFAEKVAMAVMLSSWSAPSGGTVYCSLVLSIHEGDGISVSKLSFICKML